LTTQAEDHRHTPQLIPRRLLRSGQLHHPAVLDEARRRSEKVQLRLADRITAFAGSMNFVWLHAALFGVWMLFLERNPWPTLTLMVSLEAIFLSTFVMIGQNRQAAFQQSRADHDFPDPGFGAEDQHRAHSPDPRAYRGIAQTLHPTRIGT
jgi:uncharacterized membrane protein